MPGTSIVPKLSGPETIVRGKRGRWIVNAPNGAQVSDWRFETDDLTITRSTRTTARTWEGTIVVDGTVKVRVVADGQTFNLAKPFTVQQRAGWVSTPAEATLRATGYQPKSKDGEKCAPALIPNEPWSLDGDIALSTVCVRGAVRDENLAQVGTEGVNDPDDGPNDGVWYVKSIDDSIDFDWAVHPVIADLSSPFMMQQLGTFPVGQTTCVARPQPPVGNALFISRANYYSGVERHEAGPLNSHWAEYAASLTKPDRNIKRAMEDLLGQPTVSKSEALEWLKSEFARVRGNIYEDFDMHDEPCGLTCDAASNLFNGHINYQGYRPQQ